jgi:geranylgeranyl diphosphate synthase type I
MMRTAPLALAAARGQVHSSLAAVVGRLCPESRRVCAYHFGWQDAAGRPTGTSGGKALRPALAFLSARAAQAPPQDALAGAMAVELVHNFSLLHDDVIDGDDRRRHRLTAWRVFGEGRAILAGDDLLNLASQVLIEAPSPHRMEALRRLSHAAMELNRGQYADLSFQRRLDVSIPECIEMATAKTGALISCSTSIGAVLAGAPAPVVEGLESFGRHLGLAFQAVDDLLGIWGEPMTTGKPIGSDLRQNKKTLPVVFALCAEDPYSEQVRRTLSREVIGDAEAALVIELLERRGAGRWVTGLAERETELSLRALDGLPIPLDVRVDLEEVAHYLATRDA